MKTYFLGLALVAFVSPFQFRVYTLAPPRRQFLLWLRLTRVEGTMR
jgi:hypothetical protein